MAGITQNGQKSLILIVVPNQRMQLKILSYKGNNNSDKSNNSGKVVMIKIILVTKIIAV